MRILLVIIAFGFLTGCKNFYEIDKGKYYRSAQLSKEEFELAIDTYKLKTIINLRGADATQQWYQDEIAISQAKGVKHIDIGMSASRLPHRPDLITLLDSFRTVERPMLVHCQVGADRTGLASAVYQMLYMGKTKKESLKMLSKKYFHISWFKPAIDYFVKDLWQDADWANNVYDPCQQDYKYYDKSLYCNPAVPLTFDPSESADEAVVNP